MREIKFRGISVKSNKWCVGSLLLINSKAYIYEREHGDLDDVDFGWGFEEVHLDSVGQYTGLKDKNGTPIYEGDIVKDVYGTVGIVKFYDECFQTENFYLRDTIEVIGNIYEHGDLLKQN